MITYQNHVQIEKVKSRFQVFKKFYVYRKQFPVILAYAVTLAVVTIHKCQGLSLNCAIIDLSDKIFSPGMAYVALSRVRTLDGVYLTDLNSKCFMVSAECLKEINRLRSTFKKELSQYHIPLEKSGKKRQLTGTNDICTIKNQKA